MNNDPQAFVALALFFFGVLPMIALGQKARQYRVVAKADLLAWEKELRELRRTVDQLQAGIVVRDQGKQMRFDFVKQQEPEYWYSMPVWDEQSKAYWRQAWPIRNHLQYNAGKIYVKRNNRRLWVDESIKGDVEVQPFKWERVNYVIPTQRKSRRLPSRVR
jgi:hypothetical protein